MRCNDFLFAGIQPPILLVRITSYLDAIVFLTKPGSQIAITIQRPDPNELPGAGVNQDFSRRPFRRQRKMFTRGQLKTKSFSHDTPVFISMGYRVRAPKRLVQKQPAPPPGKSESSSRAK